MAGRGSELCCLGVPEGETEHREWARERGMPVTVTTTDVQDRRADREQNLP